VRPNNFKSQKFYFCDYTELTFVYSGRPTQAYNGLSKENTAQLHMSSKSWTSGLWRDYSCEISSAEDRCRNKPTVKAKSE